VSGGQRERESYLIIGWLFAHIRVTDRRPERLRVRIV